MTKIVVVIDGKEMSQAEYAKIKPAQVDAEDYLEAADKLITLKSHDGYILDAFVCSVRLNDDETGLLINLRFSKEFDIGDVMVTGNHVRVSSSEFNIIITI